MPDSPPGHQDRHAPQTVEKIENQHQPQGRILDTHLDAGGAGIALRQAGQTAGPVSQVQCQGIVQKYGQHHHAHIAAVMAEHHLDPATPVLGFAFDGTGYGDDGVVWGGEVLLAGYREYERAYHFAYCPLPGGDQAVREPWRYALAWLKAAGIDWVDDLAPVAASSSEARGVIAQQLEAGINAPLTSSVGRLFDAVSSLVGCCHSVNYEAQAAIGDSGGAVWVEDGGQWELAGILFGICSLLLIINLLAT